MNFLIIVMVVAVMYFWKAELLHKDQWYAWWLDRVLPDKTQATWLTLALAIGMPVLLVLVVLLNMPRLLQMVLGLVVVLYCVGRTRWREELQDVVTDLDNRSPETAWMKMEQVHPGYKVENQGAAEALWLFVRSTINYRYLDGLYAPLFWFALFGPAGALLFRLNSLLLCLRGNSPSITALAARLQWWLEWLPARFVAVGFSLAGNFSTTFPVIRQLATDQSLSASEVLSRCSDAALFIDNQEPAKPDVVQRVDDHAIVQEAMVMASRYSRALQELLDRTNVICLAMIGVIVLVM